MDRLFNNSVSIQLHLKKPLLRFHGEEKQPNTVLAVLEQRSTEGNKNNMNLRLMNSSLESLAQNSFI